MRPALTTEAREKQLTALAKNLAEKQLRDGTASAQVITHYLKAGSEREHLEQRILEKKEQLLEAQTQALKSAKRVEELYAHALEAMRTYSGGKPSDDSDEPDEE